MGLAGGEAGQGLRVGASQARRWLPYGFQTGAGGPESGRHGGWVLSSLLARGCCA